MTDFHGIISLWIDIDFPDSRDSIFIQNFFTSRTSFCKAEILTMNRVAVACCRDTGGLQAPSRDPTCFGGNAATVQRHF